MKIIFFGDVFGKPGRKALTAFLPFYIKNNNPDFIIANCENAADGRGITEQSAREIFNAGVDACTSGNHLWDRKEGIPVILNNTNIVKPLNYPKSAPGNSFSVLKKENKELLIACICGQSFMNPVDSPFFKLDEYLPEFHNLTHNILIDFHAESTAEKRTLGFYFDGKISAMLGTHTHIQTADEEILENGTAYITDVGMTGSVNSVIGIKKEIAIEKIKHGLPVRHETSDLDVFINAVEIEIDELTGKSVSIKRIRERVNYVS